MNTAIVCSKPICLFYIVFSIAQISACKYTLTYTTFYRIIQKVQDKRKTYFTHLGWFYGTGRKQTATVTKINQIPAIFAVVVVKKLKIWFVVLANTETLLCFTVKQQAFLQTQALSAATDKKAHIHK